MGKNCCSPIVPTYVPQPATKYRLLHRKRRKPTVRVGEPWTCYIPRTTLLCALLGVKSWRVGRGMCGPWGVGDGVGRRGEKERTWKTRRPAHLSSPALWALSVRCSLRSCVLLPSCRYAVRYVCDCSKVSMDVLSSTVADKLHIVADRYLGLSL